MAVLGTHQAKLAKCLHTSVSSHILYNLAIVFLVVSFLAVLCKWPHSKSYC